METKERDFFEIKNGNSILSILAFNGENGEPLIVFGVEEEDTNQNCFYIKDIKDLENLISKLNDLKKYYAEDRINKIKAKEQERLKNLSIVESIVLGSKGLKKSFCTWYSDPYPKLFLFLYDEFIAKNLNSFQTKNGIYFVHFTHGRSGMGGMSEGSPDEIVVSKINPYGIYQNYEVDINF